MLSRGSKFISLIYDGDVIKYFTSFDVEDGFLILHNGKKYLFLDKRYYYSALNNADANVVLVDENSLKTFISENGVDTVGIIYALTPVSAYLTLTSLGVTVVDVEADINKIRSVKNEGEINLIKKAQQICETSLSKTFKFIKLGVTEKEVASYLEYQFKLNGADGTSFETIVAFNENSSVPHHKTSDKVLTENSVVLIDCGVKYRGYCSDTTRTFYFGTPSDEFIKAYNAVLTAHNLVATNVTNGTTGVEADAIARNYLTKNGYGEYFTHGLGHGVGVKIHESPRLSTKSVDTLTNGNCFTIEPGVYFDGKFGIRIEDTVCLVDGKVVSFNTLTKELFTV